jgi:hypothetical protein
MDLLNGSFWLLLLSDNTLTLIYMQWCVCVLSAQWLSSWGQNSCLFIAESTALKWDLATQQTLHYYSWLSAAVSGISNSCTFNFIDCWERLKWDNSPDNYGIMYTYQGFLFPQIFLYWLFSRQIIFGLANGTPVRKRFSLEILGKYFLLN